MPVPSLPFRLLCFRRCPALEEDKQSEENSKINRSLSNVYSQWFRPLRIATFLERYKRPYIKTSTSAVVGWYGMSYGGRDQI